MKQILERARQAVEFPDDDDIAFAQMVEQAVQLGPIPTAAGGLLFVDPRAAGRLEGTRPGLRYPDRRPSRRGRSRAAWGCRSNLLPLAVIWQQDFARRKPLVMRLPRFRRIDDRL